MNYEAIGKVQDRAAESGYRVRFGADGITLIGHGAEVAHPDADHALAWMEVQRLERERLKRREEAKAAVHHIVYGDLTQAARRHLKVFGRADPHADECGPISSIVAHAWRAMLAGAVERPYGWEPGPVDALIESMLDAEFGPAVPVGV